MQATEHDKFRNYKLNEKFCEKNISCINFKFMLIFVFLSKISKTAKIFKNLVSFESCKCQQFFLRIIFIFRTIG
jgi:hypothetical protein